MEPQMKDQDGVAVVFTDVGMPRGDDLLVALSTRLTVSSESGGNQSLNTLIDSHQSALNWRCRTLAALIRR
ncbi:hypothetical protein LINPERPRIM_LOCUS38156 [Linum perenne]